MSDLFRSDNVVVRSVPASDLSRWVVTFDNYGIGHGFDRPGFGEDFLRNAGISAIHVMGVREDWYQYPEMAAAMQAVRQATAGAERVMTYGSSMGGYAALRFADAAGANAVLAISPQYSIDPKKMPFETRWHQESQRIEWRPEIDGRIFCGSYPIIVFDPIVDGCQVERVKEDIDICPIKLPHVSHPATTYLVEIGLLKPLVLHALSGELDAAAFRIEARNRRRVSSFYLSNLAIGQPAHRRLLALELARRAVKTSPSSPLAGLAFARLLSAEGRHDEAIERLEGIVASTNRAPVYLVSYVDALVAAGRSEEARPHAREAVEGLRHQAHLHAWEGALLQGLGDKQAAVGAMERAIALDPRPEYCRQLQEYQADSGAGDRGRGRIAHWVSRVRARMPPAIPNLLKH
ncbi:MAG TPA: tetratricopeptide repeat protein [Brevundimonas sp.]